ncbi:unnamed protein product [Ectocarpus sp. 12 AP-2014]
MKTRSREGTGGGEPAEAEALVSLPLQPPRSSKKRKAANNGGSSGPSTPAATKKSKEVATSVEPPAPTAPEATTPGKTGENKGGSRSKTSKSASKAGEHNAAAVGGKEGQSLGKDKDGKRAHGGPITAADRMGVAPKGRCVSGRDWKARNQSQRASMQRTTATETLSSSWAKKLEIKAKRQAIMAMEKEMRDAKLQEIEDKKQEKLEREKRRQQNEMKNTTYQTISKTHKMKTMSKKQLRQIKKRQINSRTGEVEFVSPWGGGKKK